MTFWDSSALVSLLVEEADTPQRRAQLEADSRLAVWWATPVECESAIQRRLRDGSLARDGVRLAQQRLADLAPAWHEVNPTPAVRRLAVRLLRTHSLRAAGALQLAAALVLREGGLVGLHFACADARLAEAAEKEGLQLA